jgi:hypothetical protein
LRWVRTSVLGSLAAAAVLLLYVGVSRMDSDSAPTRATRAKGGPKLEFYVRRGGGVLAGQPGQIVHPREALRFSVSLDEPWYVAVLSVDGRGVVSVYHPQSPEPDRVGPGADQPLSTAIELDDTLGPESLFGVFCREPVAPKALRAAVARAPAAPALPRGCRFERIQITKVAP